MGSAALCEGVVVRVRDDSLVLAVDEVPDSGLEVPLRLEKLANTVTYNRMKAALSVWWLFFDKRMGNWGVEKDGWVFGATADPKHACSLPLCGIQVFIMILTTGQHSI